MDTTELVSLKLFTEHSLQMLEHSVNRWFTLNTDKEVLSANFVEVKEFDDLYTYQITFKTKLNNIPNPILGKDIGLTSSLVSSRS